MRLVRRLTLHLFFVIGLVFASDTWLSLRMHLMLFDADLRRDERLLGGALASAIERAWRDHGADYALDLVKDASDREGNLSLRLVSLTAPPGAPDAPEAPRAEIEFAGGQRGIAHVRDETGEERLYTYVALSVAGKAVALELSESLSHERAYLWERIRRKLGTAALMAIGCGFVAWAVGIRLVGRPIRALVEKARRIAGGDFSRPLVLPECDELSQLADEMNAMAEGLGAAAQAVAAESAARISALEQLHHADRLTTVGQLASGLAHELGTPLNVVSGRAQMILTGEAGGPEVSRNARIIVEQSARMTRIVRKLLDFSRHGGSEKRPTDLTALVLETISLLEPLAAEKSVALRHEVSAGAVLAHVDPDQIRQALTNLVMNAIQATHSGGSVAVRVARDESHSDPAGPPVGQRALVEVSDDGEGIPGNELTAIFDPFFTTKPPGEGSGLGLSVTHGIVKEHGGRIDVSSAPGRGSVFRIWLPCEDRA